jgi:alpha-tubulin suppressor-like RCC1 family protein
VKTPFHRDCSYKIQLTLSNTTSNATMLSRTAPRAVPRCCRASSTRANTLAKNGSSSRTATASYQSRAAQKQQHLSRSILAIAAAGGLATLSQFYINDGQLVRTVHAESPQDEEQAALIFEQSRKKKGVSAEENRDLISSQHLQVKRSWESPGVYAWGSNTGRVVAPDSTENNIKTPRRIAFFDGKLLRDIKLDRNFAAAIDEQGNLLQWGTGYAPDIKAPVQTLAGKNLVSLTLSKDRVIALSKNGSVYSIPASAEDQASGAKPSESSWIPFVSSSSRIAYRDITPKDLARSERVTSLAGGLEHSLFLTSAGRVFSAASATDSYPSRGQLGVPGLSWLTRPTGDFDQPHEVTTLKGFPVSAIAAGDRHSLALDSEGRLFAWGDNASGQLGFDSTAETAAVDAPSLVPIHKLYSGSSQTPRITSISAGGSNTYFTVDATRVASPGITDPAQLRTIGRVTSDTFALGSGITGSLGNSRCTFNPRQPKSHRFRPSSNTTKRLLPQYPSVSKVSLSALRMQLQLCAISPKPTSRLSPAQHLTAPTGVPTLSSGAAMSTSSSAQASVTTLPRPYTSNLLTAPQSLHEQRRARVPRRSTDSTSPHAQPRDWAMAVR